MLERYSSRLLILLLLIAATWVVKAADDIDAWAQTPPRLSYIDGEVSYWRPGAEGWAKASVNLPLAQGDTLYAGKQANFEVQFTSRGFVRGDEYSELGLVSQAPERIQFKVTAGRISFDMLRMASGSHVEVSTPYAAFIISDPGYYRIEVGEKVTHFITRHGGMATLTTADGRSMSIYPSEDIMVSAGNPVQVVTYAAPLPDSWDDWNDARSNRIGESVSARYLSPDIYGAEDLDQYGYWRVVPVYGAVWIPHVVPSGWTPYSSGYWIWDPYYEWTWVDSEPWGWAPYHYGRWVFIDGYWAWVPGPVVAYPVYSPALVAFLVDEDSASVNMTAGFVGIWWVALGWGEPLVPWWHHHKHHGKPRWEGWGGPRLINGKRYQPDRFPGVARIRYQNVDQPYALHRMKSDKFGLERVYSRGVSENRERKLMPLPGDIPIKPSPVKLYGGAAHGEQPPRQIDTRPVVSIKLPRAAPSLPWQPSPETKPGKKERLPEVIYLTPPPPPKKEGETLSRPPYGKDGGQEITPPPPPPRYDEIKRGAPAQQQERSGESFNRRYQQQGLPSPSVSPPQPERAPNDQRNAPSAFVPPSVREKALPQGQQPSTPFQRQVRPEHDNGGMPQRQQAQPLPGQPANRPFRRQ